MEWNKIKKYGSFIVLIVFIIIWLRDSVEWIYNSMMIIYKQWFDNILRDSNAILFIYIVWVIVLIIIWLLIKKQIFESRKKKIDEIIGYQNLLQRLWWDKIHYPVIWFEGIFWEPVNIDSKQYYLEEYLFWFGAKYIVDSDLKKFNLNKITISDLWYNVGLLNKIKLERLEYTWENISFEKLKQDMISKIKLDNTSVYNGLENEMQNTKNINELVEVMNKWEY